jgi:hypothetical protein
MVIINTIIFVINDIAIDVVIINVRYMRTKETSTGRGDVTYPWGMAPNVIITNDNIIIISIYGIYINMLE